MNVTCFGQNNKATEQQLLFQPFIYTCIQADHFCGLEGPSLHHSALFLEVCLF